MEILELLTPAEQKAILAIAEYLKRRRAEAAYARVLTEALLAELPAGEPRFDPPRRRPVTCPKGCPTLHARKSQADAPVGPIGRR